MENITKQGGALRRPAFLATRSRAIAALAGTALLLFVVGSAAPSTRAQAPTPTTLWYNGDLFGQSTLINHIGGSLNARVFDDFTVTNSAGWQLTSVFTNNAFTAGPFGGPPNVTQADWSIRTGLSEGNAGTIVAGGVGAATHSCTRTPSRWRACRCSSRRERTGST